MARSVVVVWQNFSPTLTNVHSYTETFHDIVNYVSSIPADVLLAAQLSVPSLVTQSIHTEGFQPWSVTFQRCKKRNIQNVMQFAHRVFPDKAKTVFKKSRVVSYM